MNRLLILCLNLFHFPIISVSITSLEILHGTVVNLAPLSFCPTSTYFALNQRLSYCDSASIHLVLCLITPKECINPLGKNKHTPNRIKN